MEIDLAAGDPFAEATEYAEWSDDLDRINAELQEIANADSQS